MTAAVFGRSLLEVTLPYFSYTHSLGDDLPLAMALSIYALREKGTRGLAACRVLGLAPTLPWIALGGCRCSGPRCCAHGAVGAGRQKRLVRRAKAELSAGVGYALAALGGILLALTVLTDGAPYSLIDAALRARGGEDNYPRITYRKQFVRELLSNVRLVGTADALEGVDAAQWLGDMRWLLDFAWYDDMLLAVLANFGWLAFLAAQAPMAVLLAASWQKCRRQTAARR